MKGFIIASFILVALFFFESAFACDHDKKQLPTASIPKVFQRYPPKLIDKRGLQETEALYQSSFQPLRVYFHTGTVDNDPNGETCYEGQTMTASGIACTADNTLTASRIAEIKSLMSSLQQRVANLLSVRRVVGNLKASLTACSSADGSTVTIPSSYRTTGVADTDIIVLVTVRPDGQGNVASAYYCQRDQSNRPIVGTVNINANVFWQNNVSSGRKRGTVLHELFHVLGFSGNLFKLFRDDNGNQYSAVQEEARTFNAATKTVNYINSPKVMMVAKKHYNCPTMKGVDLEEYGGTGTVGSHWEKRMLQFDVMQADVSWGNPDDKDEPKISEFTLALFEDSGWYKANYTAADDYKWGKNYGCSFTGRCENWNNPNYEGYYCTDASTASLQIGYCTFNHAYKGYCDARDYTTSLDGYYQHFAGRPNRGGMDAFLDYCPMVRGFSNADCRVSGALSSAYGEYRGNNGRCFTSSLTTNSKGRDSAATCYETKCSGGTLSVRVGNNWYVCPANGGTISNIQGYTGSVRCPVSNVICETPATASFENIATFGFGMNSNGQVGNGELNSYTDTISILPALIGKNTQMMAAGKSTSFVFTADKNLYAFGSNTGNRLGITGSNSYYSPAAISQLAGMSLLSICSGDGHGVVVTESNEIYVFGDNTYGQIGLGSTTSVSTPTKLSAAYFDSGVTKCACGYSHTLCLTKSNSVYAFGRNNQGQLGLGTVIAAYAPTKVIALNGGNITNIVAAAYTSFALSSFGDLYSFGSNDNGLIGMKLSAGATFTTLPVEVISNVDIRTLVASETHALAIGTDSKLYGWGKGLELLSYYNSAASNLITQVQLPTGKLPTSIACGFNFSVLIVNYNELWTFGTNDFYTQVNKGAPASGIRYSPTLVQTVDNIVDTSLLTLLSNKANATVVAGYDHVLLYLELDSKIKPTPVNPKGGDQSVSTGTSLLNWSASMFTILMSFALGVAMFW